MTTKLQESLKAMLDQADVLHGKIEAKEATPEEILLDKDEDALNDWSELVETRFSIWGKEPKLCSWKKEDRNN